MLPGKQRFTARVPDDLAQLDGYALVQKALALVPDAEAELQFASSLMTRQPWTDLHRNRAGAAAQPSSLVALSLAR
jgi:hypothetical protein